MHIYCLLVICLQKKRLKKLPCPTVCPSVPVSIHLFIQYTCCFLATFFLLNISCSFHQDSNYRCYRHADEELFGKIIGRFYVICRHLNTSGLRPSTQQCLFEESLHSHLWSCFAGFILMQISKQSTFELFWTNEIFFESYIGYQCTIVHRHTSILVLYINISYALVFWLVL